MLRLTVLIPAILSATLLWAGDSPVPAESSAAQRAEIAALVGLLELVIEADADSARQCLQTLGAKIRSGEADDATVAELKARLAAPLGKLLAGTLQEGRADEPLAADAALVAALWKEPTAVKHVRTLAGQPAGPAEQRKLALETLIHAEDEAALPIAAAMLNSTGAAEATVQQRTALAALSRADGPSVAQIVLAAYPKLHAETQPLAIELLTQRAAWSKLLVAEVAAQRLSPAILNVNQVRKLLSLEDQELSAAVGKHWGTIRTARDPARETLVAEMKNLIRGTPGDPHRGVAVFNRLCGQCHKIHGQGQEVGPDITANGRASFEQLLSNVFDPSLVIGASYQARMIRTVDGRVITGLLAEDNDERVVLKVQGGKLETIAREDVEAMKVSELSLMPEGIEKQLQPQEIADLFAFITLDKHPEDKAARLIPGTRE